MIIGHLGADPEIRYMPSGEAAVSARIATNSRWKDKQSGEQKERTEWHSCTIFGKRAEAFAQYVKKGHRIYVEGELRTRKWQDKQGIDRYTTEIVVRDFEFLESKGSGRPPHPADDPNAHPESSAATASGTTDSTPASGNADFDDDIPF